MDETPAQPVATTGEDTPLSVAVPRWVMLPVIAVAVAVVGGLFVVGWFLFTVAPVPLGSTQYVAPIASADKISLLQARIAVFAVLVQIVGGVALIATVYSAFRTVQATEKTLQLGRAQLLTNQENNREQLRVSERGQVTERFTKAIDQLGSAELVVRLGGIYALEQITRDAANLRRPVLETLTAYVQVKAPWPPKGDAAQVSSDGKIRPPEDIQVALAVIGGFATGHQPKLGGVDRPGGVDLRASDLRGAVLEAAHLEWSWLTDANLELAVLEKAHLQGAILTRANLEWAILTKAHLQGAFLTDAHLERAILTEANLDKAFLHGAVLSDATGLTQEQIDTTYMDETTLLPAEPGPDGQPYRRSTREPEEPKTAEGAPRPAPDAGDQASTGIGGAVV